jgi:hypothetical protein
MQTRQEPLSRRLLSTNGFLCIVVIFLSLLVLSYSVHRWFDHDEFAHIHSAWYVANGYTPYTDFFHNHHPLLWYCIAPILLVLGYSTKTVVILRLIMFGLTMGIALLTFLTARKATSSTTAGLLSVLLLLSMVMFLEKSIEIRPDVPQVLLGLISVYFFVSFTQSRENKHMALAGLFASFAFLFSLKTSFLLIAYAALLFHGLLRRRIPGKALLYFVLSLLVPLLLFLGYLVASGSFADYVLNNWLMNMRWLYTLSPRDYLRRSFATQNALFWSLSAVAIAFILLKRKTSEALRAIAFIGLFLLASVLLVKTPHRQYFMFAIALLCIASAYLIEQVVARFRLRVVHTLVLVIVVLFQPLQSFAPQSIRSGLRDSQLARVEFVLDNSASSDLVYDGNIQFNLYRPDLHYFWFSVQEKRGLDTYNLVTNNGYGDYDGCQLIKSKRPRLISDFALDFTACGLRALYDETKYDGLYMLRELEGMSHPLWRDFGGVAALLGYTVEELGGAGDEHLQITLWWQALAEMDRDYTAFIHLVGRDGTILAHADHLLILNGQPSSGLAVGDRGNQRSDLTLPPGGLDEGYVISLGLYYWESGERLAAWDELGQRVIDDAILLSP